MNRKIKFEKESTKRSNTIGYEIVNRDLKRLEEWHKMREEIIFNINQLRLAKESCIYVRWGINEIIRKLKEMLDITESIIDTEKDNIIYRCPKMAEYIK